MSEKNEFLVAGVMVVAVPSPGDELGCDYCVFNKDAGCSVSGLMDSGNLPDCSDTPNNHSTLGYRCHFVNK